MSCNRLGFGRIHFRAEFVTGNATVRRGLNCQRPFCGDAALAPVDDCLRGDFDALGQNAYPAHCCYCSFKC
jgi:hypothetical protein